MTNELDWDGENVIAVKADNSDDPSYPVGKPQNLLDFTYFGGIYRDCWLVAHNKVFITNANYENEVAGGGLFVSFADVSEKSAIVNLKAHVRNLSEKNERVTVTFNLKISRVKSLSRSSRKYRSERERPDMPLLPSGSIRLLYGVRKLLIYTTWM